MGLTFLTLENIVDSLKNTPNVSYVRSYMTHTNMDKSGKTPDRSADDHSEEWHAEIADVLGWQ